MIHTNTDQRSAHGAAHAEYTFFQKVMIVAGAAVVLLIFWVAGPVLALLFAGVLLGAALRGLGVAVARLTGLGERAALTLALGLIAAGLAAAAWFIGREMASQFDTLLGSVRVGSDQLRAYLAEREWGRQAVEWWAGLSWQPSGGGLLTRVTGVISVGAQVVSAVGIVVGMGLFLAYSPDTYRDGVLALVPPAHRRRWAEVLDELACVLQRWTAGRVIDMAVVGTVTGVALYFMGSPAPLALGLLTGLILFVPFFGPIIATIPAALASLPDGPEWALAVVALYAGIQVAEGFLLMPFITHRTVELPAAVVIGNQLFLGALLGFMGVLLASPIAAVAMVLVKRLYIQDRLGEEPTPVGGCAQQQEGGRRQAMTV